jgi:hypothetical protein
MGQRWGPVADLEVAPDVQRLLGGELAVRELLAQLTGPVWCQRCHREIDLATTPASLLAKASDPDATATGGMVRVAFTHASCVRSQAIIDQGVDQRFLEDAGTDVTVVCGLRPATPRAFVAWETSGTDLYAQSAGGETLDVAVSSRLEQGFVLMTDDPMQARLPNATGWRVRVRGDQIQIRDADGYLDVEATAPMSQEWQQAARSQGRCVLLTGTGLELASGGVDGMQRAAVAGRLVGASARVVVTRSLSQKGQTTR